MSRTDAASRLRRLLAVIPWILEHQGATLTEIASRFGLTTKELRADLDLIPYCGLPPYSPDRLIDCRIEDGRVYLRFAEYFGRPISLTPGEGFALLAAGRTLLAVPETDPNASLANALAKLADRLDATGGVAVELGADRFVGAVRDAAQAGERLEIDYYASGRDAHTTRRIDPQRVYAQSGEWYLDAYCHLAGGQRRFRVDRIEAVRPTGEHFEPDTSPAAPEGSVFTPSPDDVRVTLLLDPEERWVVETYPAESVTAEEDGRLRVVLVAGAPAFIERLLLRLGPAAEVVAPDGFAATRRAAARRILARYGDR